MTEHRSSGPAWVQALLQLVLAALVIHSYGIVSDAFFRIFVLATAGFAVHAVLPPVYRLPFFVLLSMGGALLVFAPIDTLWLLGSGGALIGLANLPLSVKTRSFLLVSVGVVLAVVRTGIVPAPWSAAVWPILGSMFMFRLVLYVMASGTDARERRPWWSLAYFFMLPNLVFPLFPVVDYQTFRRTYFDRDAGEIYGLGLLWIARGLTHLLVYRYVYHRLIGDAESIATLGDLSLIMLATLLLYLHVSGQFHVIAGMLHLFGFRLPETHRLYFLSSSFTELCNRINVYWTDFMTKTVFLPAYFRVKERGPKEAFLLSTVIVFTITWLLHSYQWFWLRGRFPITLQDGAFWSLVCALVIVGGLRRLKAADSGRGRTGNGAWDWGRGVSTVITFLVLCVLWSMWSTESLTLWLWILGAARNVDAKGVWIVGVTLGAVLLLGARDWQTTSSPPRRGVTQVLFHPATRTWAPLILLLLLAQPAAQTAIPAGFSGVLQAVRAQGLNERDLSTQHRGYYEQLEVRAQLHLPEIGDGRDAGEAWQSLDRLGLLNERRDLLLSDLMPSRHTTWNGRPFSTNRWGMRDRDYAMEKPADTLRIALLGPSHVMGNNVGDGDEFASVVEERLNAEFSYGAYRRFEILNFGVDDHSLPQQLAMLELRARAFAPDMVIVTHFRENREMTQEFLLSVGSQGLELKDPDLERMLSGAGLREMGTGGVPIPYASARHLAERLGVQARMPYGESRSRAIRIADHVLAHSFARLAKEMRASGIAVAVLALNVVIDEQPPIPLKDVLEQERLKVFDLVDVYADADRPSLRVAPWDDHPNTEGHRLIAARLYAELTRFITSGAVEQARRTGPVE